MSVYQGIDIGSTKIRKITIKGRWGRFMPSDSTKPGKKILLLPSNMVTFRQLTFPFTDKKRIREIIPGELIDSVAVNLDRTVWDVSTIVKDKANTFIAPKEMLDGFLKSYGNATGIIDTEPCAISRVVNYNNLENAMVIDFGAGKTSFYGIRDKILNLVRVRISGVAHIDRILADQLNTDPESACEIKKEQGMTNKTVALFMESLINSAYLTKPLEYERIVITGGGSMMPGLKDYLEEKFELPVNFFNLPGELSPHLDVSAFGAALYEMSGDEKVNLKEERQKTSSQSYRWLFVLAIPLILFSVNLKIKENQLKKENTQLNQVITATIRKVIPDIGNLSAPKNQLESMVAQAGKSADTNGMKALDIMANISGARKDLDVNLYEMDIIDNVMRIRGESDSFQTVDKLKTQLAGYFSGVEIQDQKTKPSGKVDFTIKMELSANETEG